MRHNKLYKSDVEQLGNIKGYLHLPRAVMPMGALKHPDLILKLYSMTYGENPNHVEQKVIEETKNFLTRKIEAHEIDTNLGLGFAIRSHDMLNIAMWDKNCPIVLKNDIYLYEENLFCAQHTSVDTTGSFCIWELEIVNHEKEAWKKYLSSSREAKDKLEYLTNVIKGKL
jgi:hypothetical protein